MSSKEDVVLKRTLNKEELFTSLHEKIDLALTYMLVLKANPQNKIALLRVVDFFQQIQFIGQFLGDSSLEEFSGEMEALLFPFTEEKLTLNSETIEATYAGLQAVKEIYTGDNLP